MSDEILWPTRPSSPGTVRRFEVEAMRELRIFSREGREHELGSLLLALAARWSLSMDDMVIATERSQSEVEAIIETFRRHDELCRRNAINERLRRQPLAFAR